MKQCQSHQCLLHFGIKFSAACDTVVQSLFHGKFLVSQTPHSPRFLALLLVTYFFPSFSVFFPTSKYCRDPELNIGLLSLQSTISVDDPMQSYSFKYDSHYKNSYLYSPRLQLAPELQTHIQLPTWYFHWVSINTRYLKFNWFYMFDLLTFSLSKNALLLAFCISANNTIHQV